MSYRMYVAERNSKIYIYIIMFAAAVLGWGIFYYTRPLTIESACSDVTEKTTGLTKSFGYDPLSSYEYAKAKCMEDVLGSKK